MDDDQIFARVAALRREIAQLVEGLSDAELATPSLCAGWDVRTVAAHLTMLPTVSRMQFARAMFKYRGDFDRANDALARETARQPIGEIVSTLRTRATSRAVPPFSGPLAPFTDLLVHEADICIPLGRPSRPESSDVEAALDYLADTPRGFLPKKLLDGIRLVATDLDHEWRDGAEIRGEGQDLMLAVCGRREASARLTGPGLDVLASGFRRSRVPAPQRGASCCRRDIGFRGAAGWGVGVFGAVGTLDEAQRMIGSQISAHIRRTSDRGGRPSIAASR